MPLAPSAESSRRWASRERARRPRARILQLVGQVAPTASRPDPRIGTIAGVAVKAASDIGASALGDHKEQQGDSRRDVVATLRRIAADEPLVLVIDDAHWIDEPSARGRRAALADDLEAARRSPSSCPTTPKLSTTTHPLTRAPRATSSARPALRDLRSTSWTPRTSRRATSTRATASFARRRLGAWLHEQAHTGTFTFLGSTSRRSRSRASLREVDGRWTLDGSIDGTPGAGSSEAGSPTAQTPDKLIDRSSPDFGELGEGTRATCCSRGSLQGPRFLSARARPMLEKQDEREVLKPAECARGPAHDQFEDVDGWWSDLLRPRFVRPSRPAGAAL